MPFQSSRPQLMLSSSDRLYLEELSKSRTASLQKVERATMMLKFSMGIGVSVIAREMHTSRPRVDRCLDKSLQFGVMAALEDFPGRGRPRVILDEDRTWVVNLVSCSG